MVRCTAVAEIENILGVANAYDGMSKAMRYCIVQDSGRTSGRRHTLALCPLPVDS